MTDAPFPPASPHGEITEPFPDVFFVTGGVRMAPLMSFSRNMTIVREGERVVLINSMRLSEEGLTALEALGTVTDVIRLAGFHGMDDPFYKDRYGAKIWALEGTSYRRGFAVDGSEPGYFEADVQMNARTALPLEGASLHTFSTPSPEGMLRLSREGGILVTGDSLQNWATTNRYFSLPGKLMMKMMGFIKAHNLGPGWIKAARPKTEEVRGIAELDFEHVLPAHGDAVIGGARGKYRAVLEAYQQPS